MIADPTSTPAADARRRCPRKRRCGERCCRTGDLCADRRRAKCVTGRGRCPATADGCLSPETSVCDADQGCFCFTERVEGRTRCGQFTEGTTCTIPCSGDAECADLGLGAFCAEKTGTSCCFGLDLGDGFCVLPCPN